MGRGNTGFCQPMISARVIDLTDFVISIRISFEFWVISFGLRIRFAQFF